MQFTTALFALVASSLSVVTAQPGRPGHQAFHARGIEKRATVVANSKITLLAAKPAFKDAVEGLDSSKPFINTIVNNYTEDATVVFWSDMSFALAVTPYNPNPPAPNLIVRLPAGSSKVVSFTNQYSGAYAAIFDNTPIQAGGGVGASWVELTTGPGNPVVDVSFLPDMTNKWTSVETDQCISDWTNCSFKCNDGSSTCYTAPVSELIACQGPSSGHEFDAGPNGAGPWNGGCRISKTFTTTFSGPN